MYFLLLTGHLVGNYYLKAFRFMRTKDRLLKLLIQSLIYTTVLSLFMSFFVPIPYFLIWVAMTFVVHFVLDFWHWLLLRIVDGKRNQHQWALGLLIFNLLLHFLYYYLFLETVEIDSLNRWGRIVLGNILFLPSDQPILYRVQLLFGYLFLIKPSSYIMRHTLNVIFKPSLSLRSSEEPIDSVGTIIGNIERIIVFTLGVMNLYSSIALVITAKSLARFKQLEDRSFAERYLIGTLLSFLIALLCLLFVFQKFNSF